MLEPSPPLSYRLWVGAKHLIVGLDGAELSLIEALGPSRLPHLTGLMARGAFGAMRTVPPHATLPNWLTFLTALDPGHHGVFDFTERHGYSVRFTGGTARRAPLWLQRLDAAGMVCAAMGFPGTWPPPELQHGLWVSGWDSPVAHAGGASFVGPRREAKAFVQRFGALAFDDVDEFRADEEGWHRRLPDALSARVQRKVHVATTLLCDRSWDVFAVYFGESDTAAHHLWGLHDPRSPRHPSGTAEGEQKGLTRVYESLDQALGQLLERAGPGAEVTVVSDHGSGGSSDRVLYLNRVLARAGLLTFRSPHAVVPSAARIKDLALKKLPAPLRERLFRLGGTALPSLLESRVRFGAIRMSHTRAFSDELNYFPAVHLNLRGREPEGTVTADEVHTVVDQVRRALLNLRDPWTGEPVVRRVLRREEVYGGPHVPRAPDLILEMHLVEGYGHNLQPSSTAPPGKNPWRRLEPEEYLSRKGRSLPGSHRPNGLFIAAGPAVRAHGPVDAHIADAAVTALARMGVQAPPLTSGRILREILHRDPTFREGPARASDTADTTVSRATTAEQQERLAQRLQALGYIDT